ncbi:DEAD/DEAH box helicase [Peptoniphilus sp. MSJ-1]|uniref:DEAD/DEAH box helicase n=1 Tax=Peptoniphilus ovalis TaxID=2841503 RepID=A0ABS6FH20_9FIRM|nr:DEAD/DEAH box helicase [Peptoniphilus ovalis]MBU5669471.1 DEAD/DEAH box helicase [Peptoniphilus ovalis]
MISTKTELLPHQKTGYDKLIKLKVGALYMGMGTGKTRTAIELIKDRFNKNKVNYVIWFCPCSVKKNLEMDIKKHSSGLIENTSIIGIESISMSDKTFLETLNLVQFYDCYLVVDESNLVKNHNALRTKRITALSEVCKYKLILNGTPVTRNEADLYSQWCILDKRIFGYRTFYSFAANHLEYDDYGRVRRVLNVNYLTDKIAPYSYEISKEKCLDLPKKVTEDFWFSLTDEQDEHYREVLMEMTSLVNEWSEATIYRLLNAMQLITAGRYIYNLTDVVLDDAKIKHSSYFKNIEENPRMEMLEYILDKIDNKVIVWCKYHFEIEDIKKLLSKRGLKYTELHGKITLKQREKNLYDFEHNKDIKVLIGNKTTGGYGLNLQFCNEMIYYNPDFDWGTAKQSEDRIHRIGQDRQCYYYNIYSNTGIDNLIKNCLERKENLEAHIRSMLNKKNILEVLENDKNRTGDKTERETNKRIFRKK